MHAPPEGGIAVRFRLRVVVFFHLQLTTHYSLVTGTGEHHVNRNSAFYPLTLRGFITGVIGLVIITASSMYVALRMGALPWPTVFVTVVSMAVLSRMKDSTLQEINTTHTLMSAGAMVAGGLAFTLPGLWMLNPAATFPLSSLIALTVVGAVLGTLFTTINRRRLIEKEKLPYPMGEAAYATLKTAEDHTGAVPLFSSMGFSALFTYLRDGLGAIPSVLTIWNGNTLFPALQMWVSPMALGIGAVIGPLLAGVWFLGMVIGYYVIQPVATVFFGAEIASGFRNDLGIGLMIGTGIGIFIKAVISFVKSQRSSGKMEVKKEKLVLPLVLCVMSAVVLVLFTEITILESVLVIIGVWLATYLSGMLTGQTGVNPMEIFAILVLLAVSAVFNPSLAASFSIAGVVAVAAGLAGDVMNDFKSGHMLGTPVRAQVIAEAAGGVIGAVVASLVLMLLLGTYGSFGPGTELPAPQAAAVSAMVSGLGSIPGFVTGLVVGIGLCLFNVPAATLGLGVYLGTNISMIMGLGALVALIVKKASNGKQNADRMTSLISSGFLGGEGITGVLTAIFSMF